MEFPIWYTPTDEDKKGAKSGTLVADLIQQGAQALNDQELTELLVGKSTWVRNTVTDGLSGFCGARTANARFGM